MDVNRVVFCMQNAKPAVVAEIIKEFEQRLQPERARFLAGFFKTGPGQYAEGDQMLGISVPETRKLAARYGKAADLPEIAALLKNKWHEVRLVALIMLVKHYAKADSARQRAIYDFYLAHTKYINNWDLVDLSAHATIGQYLLEHPEEKPVFLKLIKSKNLWERRIAVLGMFPLVKASHFELPLQVAEALLADTEDLMHKAVGWMLRNVGDGDVKVLKAFLDKNLSHMPRTALRYAIEHFDQTTRREYLTRK